MAVSSEVSSKLPSSFLEHQYELSKLSEYIEEKQQLVSRLLEVLGSSEEELQHKVRSLFMFISSFVSVFIFPVGFHVQV